MFSIPDTHRGSEGVRRRGPRPGFQVDTRPPQHLREDVRAGQAQPSCRRPEPAHSELCPVAAHFLPPLGCQKYVQLTLNNRDRIAWVHSHVDITVHSSGKQLVESTDAEAQILRTSLVFPTIPSLFSGQLSVVFVVRSIQKNNSSLKTKTKTKKHFLIWV